MCTCLQDEGSRSERIHVQVSKMALSTEFLPKLNFSGKESCFHWCKSVQNKSVVPTVFLSQAQLREKRPIWMPAQSEKLRIRPVPRLHPSEDDPRKHTMLPVANHWRVPVWMFLLLVGGRQGPASVHGVKVQAGAVLQHQMNHVALLKRSFLVLLECKNASLHYVDL